MIEFENECVGCPPELGCLGSSCRYAKMPHCYCDECNTETGNLYIFPDEPDRQLCHDCMTQELDEALCNLTLTEKMEILNVKEIEP